MKYIYWRVIQLYCSIYILSRRMKSNQMRENHWFTATPRGDCTHLPTPVHSKHSECQLHKWANKRTRKQVMTCSYCDITLCVQCYKSFHTVLNLNCIKADIENDQEININTYPSVSHRYHVDIHMVEVCRV